MPKTPRGKHSEGVGRPAGKGKKQGGFSILGKIGWRLLSRKNKGGFDNPGR